MSTKIVFNGKEYASVEEMPAEVRQAYERLMRMAAAIPKGPARVFQKTFSLNLGGTPIASSQIIFNGRKYASAEEMPPEVRQAYERVMDTLDADRNGVPDILEDTPTDTSEPGVNISTKIVIDGQEYTSLEDMPPELRRSCEEQIKNQGLPALPVVMQPEKDRWAQIRPAAEEAGDNPRPLPSPNRSTRESLDRTQPLWLVIAVLLIIILVLLGMLGYEWMKK
jgi:hypothetical protein